MRLLSLVLFSLLVVACDDGAPPASGDAGTVCFGPECAPPCTRNADCPAGQACDGLTRRCVPDRNPCVDRSDCFAGEVCLDGICALPTGADADATPDAIVDAAAPQDAELDAAVLDAEPDVATPDAGEADAAVTDASPPDAGDPDAAALDLAVPDAEPDLGPEPDAALEPDAAPEPDAFVPPPPPPVGVYRYRALPVGGLRDVQRLAFHPSGDYALAAAVSGPIYVYDWATEQSTRVDPPGARVYWTDIAFTPDGAHAILTGYRLGDDGDTAVVYVFDDAAWRVAADPAALQPRPDLTVPGDRAIAVKLDPTTAQPWVLRSRDTGRSYAAVLQPIDADAGQWLEPSYATATSGGASDFDFVPDAFGGSAMLVVCGFNGASHTLHTTIGGVPEWRRGQRNTGNLSSVARHPGGDYALVISSSGRRVHWFSGGALRDESVNFARLGLWRVAFQPDGRRALVVGRTGLQPVRGNVIEYRHGVEAPLAEVPIADFDRAPYNAGSNHYLRDAAFHPGCDGGLVAGGHTTFNGSTGLLIRFDIEGGQACP